MSRLVRVLRGWLPGIGYRCESKSVGGHIYRRKALVITTRWVPYS